MTTFFGDHHAVDKLNEFVSILNWGDDLFFDITAKAEALFLLLAFLISIISARKFQKYFVILI